MEAANESLKHIAKVKEILKDYQEISEVNTADYARFTLCLNLLDKAEESLAKG